MSLELSLLLIGAICATLPGNIVGSEVCCQHGGYSVKVSDGTEICKCKDPYYGNSCEKDDTTCPDNCNACKNGGTLRVSGNSISCDCAAGYTGALCDKVVPPAPTTPKPKCGKNFEPLDLPNGTWVCVNYLLQKTNYFNAPAACAALDSRARLVVVQNAAKNNAIKAHLKTLPAAQLTVCNYGGAPTFFTAGQRLTDCTSKWYWKPNGPNGAMSEITYTDWWPGQPDCAHLAGFTPETCVTFWQTVGYQWNDAACEAPACAICEIPA